MLAQTFKGISFGNVKHYFNLQEFRFVILYNTTILCNFQNYVTLRNLKLKIFLDIDILRITVSPTMRSKIIIVIYDIRVRLVAISLAQYRLFFARAHRPLSSHLPTTRFPRMPLGTWRPHVKYVPTACRYVYIRERQTEREGGRGHIRRFHLKCINDATPASLYNSFCVFARARVPALIYGARFLRG